MESRRIHTNIAQTTFPAHQTGDVRVNAARCFLGYALLSDILNAALTVRTAMLHPPPLNKQ